mgnify:CR=1 FL=1
MSELFEPKKDENTSNIEGLFPPGGAEAEAKRTPDDKLAEFVGQETIIYLINLNLETLF